MDKFFINTYRYLQSKKLFGFLLLVLMFSGLALVGSHIQFEEDITKLIPIHEENKDAGKVFKTMNFADKIMVNMVVEGAATTDDLTGCANRFIDSITAMASGYVKDIQGKVADEDVLNTLDFVYNNLPLFLDEEDYATISQKLQKDSIQQLTEKNYKSLVSPSGFVVKKSILRDPLGLSFLGIKKLQQLNFGGDIQLSDGFLLSKDKKNLLLFITPQYPSSETGENSKFASILYHLQDELNQEFKGKVHTEFYGGALVAVENAAQIKHDIQFTVGIAVTILLLILIFFYRKIWLPFILFIPTIFGGLLAIAVLFVVRAKISAISLGIGSILLGVTLDYSLHVLTHIRENKSIASLYHEITKPVLMSSLTTALAFLCLLFLDSQALQDLGIFAAISSLGASVFALVFIPHVYKDTGEKTYKSTVIDTFSNIPFHKKKWVFVVLALLGIISLFTYNKVLFNKDLNKLNYEPPQLMAARDHLDKLTDISSKSVYIAAYGNSVQEALEVNDQVFKKLNSLKAKHTILGFSSVGTLVQSNKSGQDAINRWNRFWAGATKDSLQQNLIKSGATLGFKPVTFHQFYDLLDKDFHPLSVHDYKELQVLNVDDFISFKNQFATVTTLVKLNDTEVNQFNKHFKNKPGVLVIDRKGMNETFLGNLKNDFNVLVFYSLVVVILILLVSYRSLSLTLVTAVPIAVTWFLTLGIMGLLGVQFNIFNIIISTFIFGLGIDYSIFITNGLLHEYRTGERTLPTHKTSIILSVITTILGVGVLILAKHPALYTISLVSLIGILSAMVCSFTVQPVLFSLVIGGEKRRSNSIRLLIHSAFSFTYYGVGTFFISLVGFILVNILPLSKKKMMPWVHRVAARFMSSVLYTNPFVKKTLINEVGETFEKPAIIIANHTSFLDILAMNMVHSKIIFLVNDWVYNSPVLKLAMKLTGSYPVSEGIENGLEHLKQKIAQGYSLIVFPEGSRSYTHKINRFHKGAFYLAQEFNLDIVPVIIHGNSEVLPKGDFVIRNGSITIRILDRIKVEDISFGTTIRGRTKTLSTFFKERFTEFRKECESYNYFHSLVLCEYRYKNDSLYKKVNKDLKEFGKVYQIVLKHISETAKVLHLSGAYGQLDFLMALDSPERSITSIIKNEEILQLLQNSYVTQNEYYHLDFAGNIEGAMSISPEVLIISTLEVDMTNLKNLMHGNSCKMLILLQYGYGLLSHFEAENEFTIFLQDKNVAILTSYQHPAQNNLTL